MKMKKCILLTLFILAVGASIAQQKLTELDKLVSIGKVYGFLKYYHPVIAKGQYNWDKEFLEYFPIVLEAEDKEALSDVYLKWVDSLGKIEACKKCDAEEQSFDKNFDLSWTRETTLFNDSLISRLRFIENNRNQDDNFYVSAAPVGKIEITNEPVYQGFDFPGEEYRLLGLFKYWNIIEYFYPYKYLTDQSWGSVLQEMIPKFQRASDKAEYQNAIRELVAKLDDTHAWVSFSSERPKYLPVKISHIEGKAVVSGFYNDSLASINNLKLGDVILKVNALDVDTEMRSQLKYVSGSNRNIKIRSTYDRIFIGSEDSIRLSIERNQQIEEIVANRYDLKDLNYWNNPNTLKYKSINDEIGYVNMASVKGADIYEIFKSFKDKEALIIDLRNYPAPIYNLFARHLHSERRDFAKAYIPNIEYPGKFYFKKNLKTGGKNKKSFKGKVIILVNEESISLSEFTVMALQTADNAITVGSQTAGADGNVAVFEYMGGYRTAISGIGCLYPDGTETQRKGVKIDIEVKSTIQGLRQGRDEVLEKAIEIANE